MTLNEISNIASLRIYFPVSQPQFKLSLCLHFEEFQPIYAYKGYVYKKCYTTIKHTAV